jgi:hypothetical protein
MIALVGKARLELHRLFAAQAEVLLQFQANAHVIIADLRPEFARALLEK